MLLRKYCLLFLVVCFSIAGSAYAASDNLDKVTSMVQELKTWEQEGDWDKFYSNKDKYESEIANILDSVEPGNVNYYKAKFMAWKVANAFAKESRQAFDAFIIAIRDIETDDKESVAYIETVIEDLRKSEKIRLKDRVTSIYKELLLQAKDEQKIKNQALKFYQDGDLDSSVALYRAYVAIAADDITVDEYYQLAETFAYNGFSDMSDAAFAEEIYEDIALKFGQESLSDSHMYLRALNLENMGFFERALKVYLKLVDTYPESFLKDEANYRAASIAAYRFGDFESANNLFSKVLNNSLFDVENQKNNLLGVAAEDNYNLSTFLSTVKGEEEILRKNYATLRVRPSKTFLGQSVDVDAMAISSDTGCLVSTGLYLWSGDYGTYNIESNVADFSTQFENAGFRNIFLVEKGTQGILGFDSYVYASYDAMINTENGEYLIGQPVVATINIFPVLPADFTTIEWEVEGHGKLSVNSKTVEFQFDKAGTFNIVAKIKYFGKDFATVTKKIIINKNIES